MARATLLAVLLLPGNQALAEMCTMDVVPAATLLLPYFEVDLDNSDGVTTIFFVNNALPDPALVHVTIWTNWAVPILDFDIYLTGYDVQAFDLRDMIVNGNLPITADQQDDPDDTISPSGDPSWDGSFPVCDAIFPFYINPMITGTRLQDLQSALTGNITSSGECSGEDLGDNIARGYITMDNVTECNFYFPSDPSYFAGIASQLNQLWGDYFLIDLFDYSMPAQPLVHVEASEEFDSDSTPTNYTFYGRYTQALGGSDHREPLGTAWGARYLNGGFFNGGTQLVVWRDPTANQTSAGFTCGFGAGAGPDWSPLDETQVLCFDEQENFISMCDGPSNRCFPLATQKLPFGEGNLALPFDFGWCQLKLNIPDDTISDDVDFPSAPPGPVAQSYIGVIHSSDINSSGGLQTAELAHACSDLDPLLAPPIFADGFESGDTGAWSSTSP